MIDRTPKPIALRDQVRILPYGKTVWTVESMDSNLVHLRSRTGAVQHILRTDVYYRLVRVTLVPFPAPPKPRPSTAPRLLAVGDKCRFGTGTFIWRVTEIDVYEVKLEVQSKTRYVTWGDIKAGKVRHADGAAILRPVHAHV